MTTKYTTFFTRMYDKPYACPLILVLNCYEKNENTFKLLFKEELHKIRDTLSCSPINR